MTRKRLWDLMREREPIKDNPLCDYHTKEPLSFSVAEVVSSLDEGMVISMPYEKSSLGHEDICCVYPLVSDGKTSWSDFKGYPSWKEERDLGLENIGGAIIGAIGDPFFYRITEEKFRKGLIQKERQRLRIDRIRKPLLWYDDRDRLMGNWFSWNDNYFNFVRNIFEGLPEISMKKYGEPSVLVEAPVVFEDLDEICTLGRVREKLWRK